MDRIEGIPEGYRLGKLDEVKYADRAELRPTYITFELIPIEQPKQQSYEEYEAEMMDRMMEIEDERKPEQPKQRTISMEQLAQFTPEMVRVFNNLTPDDICRIRTSQAQPKQLEAVIVAKLPDDFRRVGRISLVCEGGWVLDLDSADFIVTIREREKGKE